MKRPRLDARLGPRNIVSLNVGGQRFQTSRETLGRSAFFASLLEFDGGGDQDGEGNIFVDRSSRLFEVILECWRTALRPPQKTISLWKKQLLEECKYFAADDAAARIAGRTCEADLSPGCRRIALDEAEGNATLLNVFDAPFLERKDVAQLQLPPLLLDQARCSDSPVLAGDFRHCRESLNVLLGCILPRLLEDPMISQHVVIAGGAVVGALTGCTSSDVDLFLVGAPAGDEEQILSKIYHVVMRACEERRGAEARLLVTRSPAAVTLFKHHGAPIQIILSTYSTLEDLLVGFDVDCAACAFVLRTDSFVCSPRARRALEYRVNLMQSERNSAAYAHRLEKYASRCFAVGLPGLDASLLAQELLSGVYIRTKRHDLLLRVLSGEDAPGTSSIQMPAGSKTSEVRCRRQIAKRVSGIQRMAVLTFVKVRDVESPCVGRSTGKTVDARHLDDGVILLHSEERRGEFHLLWGLSCSEDDDYDTDSEEDDGEGGYSITPLAKAVILFDSCLKKQTLRLAQEERVPEDGESMCGVVPRVAKTMRSNESSAKNMVEARVYSQLSRKEKISFVYDFCDANRPFSSLNFVRDAEQTPLRNDMTRQQFVALYGLPQKLSFTAAVKRPVADHDWWSDLYGAQ